MQHDAVNSHAKRLQPQTNFDVAERLDEIAAILEAQRANPYRVQAYRRAAQTVRELPRALTGIVSESGMEGLDALPGIGASLAQTIFQLVKQGRAAMLDRLRGEGDAVELLATVPGIGRQTATRLAEEGGIHTLEELEAAAHDGRLTRIAGFRGKRLAGVRDALAGRLGRVRQQQTDAAAQEPSVAEILDVDREYRAKAAAGTLRSIAPRRFNPGHEVWLPILHAERGKRHYTCLFSNTALAHRLGRTRDWVVIYFDEGQGERQCTVVTETRGVLAGRRVIRGREAQCVTHYESA